MLFSITLRQLLENQFPDSTSRCPPFIRTEREESISAIKPRALSWFPSWSRVPKCADLLVSISQCRRFQQKVQRVFCGGKAGPRVPQTQQVSCHRSHSRKGCSFAKLELLSHIKPCQKKKVSIDVMNDLVHTRSQHQYMVHVLDQF